MGAGGEVVMIQDFAPDYVRGAVIQVMRGDQLVRLPCMHVLRAWLYAWAMAEVMRRDRKARLSCMHVLRVWLVVVDVVWNVRCPFDQKVAGIILRRTVDADSGPQMNTRPYPIFETQLLGVSYRLFTPMSG